MAKLTNKDGANKPNILLFIADQHRADSLGFWGRMELKTPNLDRLAQDGVAFENALSPCPLCTPARSSIFTSLYPHQARGFMGKDPHGIFDPIGETDMTRNGTSLREPAILTEQLRKAGYFTGYAGKWHLGPDVINDWFDETWEYNKENKQAYSRYCQEKGFPDGVAFNDMDVRSKREPFMSIPVTKVSAVPAEHSTDAFIKDHALDILKNRPDDQPFFMVCGFEGPHPPFKIPEPYYSMYDPEKIPEPPNFRPNELEPISNRNSYYRKLWLDHGDNWEQWKKSVAVYRGFVTLIDDQVGKLLAYLENEGIRDNTIVIYCADHGEMLGQHGLWHKMCPYEESVRVPLIVSGKGIAGGIRSGAGVSLLDIAPTILGLAGLNAPEEYEGIDLGGILQNQADESAHEYLFSEQRCLGPFHQTVDWRMVTNNTCKYIWNQGDLGELYDLQADPYETNNLILSEQHKDISGQFVEKLCDWMESKADPLYSVFLNSIQEKK